MRKEAVNPMMDLSKKSATPEPIADEKMAAEMPQVSKMPTGMKCAKKCTIGMG